MIIAEINPGVISNKSEIVFLFYGGLKIFALFNASTEEEKTILKLSNNIYRFLSIEEYFHEAKLYVTHEIAIERLTHAMIWSGIGSAEINRIYNQYASRNS